MLETLMFVTETIKNAKLKHFLEVQPPTPGQKIASGFLGKEQVKQFFDHLKLWISHIAASCIILENYFHFERSLALSDYDLQQEV